MTLLLSLAVVLLLPYCVNSRWCTRLVSQQYVQTYIEHAQCNRSYQAACGWFTSKECTYYEIVDCMKERNHTVLRYKVIESCCPGYYLDPINNVTCLRSEKENVTYDTTVVSVTSEAPVAAVASSKESTVKPDSSLDAGWQKGVFSDDDDQVLSNVVIALIISFVALLACVSIIIVFRVLKRKRNARQKNNSDDIKLSEKMIQNPAT